MPRRGCFVEQAKRRSVSADANLPCVLSDIVTNLIPQVLHISAEFPHVHTISATAGVSARHQFWLYEQRGRSICPLKNNATERNQAVYFRDTAHHVLQTFRKIPLERFRVRLQIALAQVRQMPEFGTSTTTRRLSTPPGACRKTTIRSNLPTLSPST